MGLRWFRPYIDSLRTGRSGNRMPVEAINLHPSRPTLVPTQPRIKWVPDVFLGGKAAGGVALSTHFILAQRLKEE
jgi:hypothetical protein